MVISTRTRLSDTAAPSLTIRDHLNTLFYYHRLALIVFLTIAVLGLIGSLVVPLPYQAQAKLLVLYAGYYDQSNTTQGIPLAPAIGELASVEAQILQSPELDRAVVLSELGPNPTQKEIDAKLLDFESRVHLEQTDLANTISLTYTDRDPQRAADALSRLLNEYFRQRATIFVSGRASLLNEQLDSVRDKLNQANAALLAFQQAHGIVSINDQISQAVALENLLIQRKLENDASLAQDRGGLVALKAATEGVKPDISLFVDNSDVVQAVATMQLQLLQLDAQRADLVSRYLPSSPYVTQIDKRIADLQADIDKRKRQLMVATRTGHNSYYDTVQDRLAGLETNIAGEVDRQKVLADQVVQAHARSQSLIQLAYQLHQLEAKRDLLDSRLRARTQQAEQADIEQAQASRVNSTNVRIIQAPLPPARPVLSRAVLIVASLFAAIVISILVVLVAASLRDTFLSPEQIERSLSLHVLSAPIRRRRNARASAKSANDSLPGHSHVAYGRMASTLENSSAAECKLVSVLAPSSEERKNHVIQGLAVEMERRLTRPILIFVANVESSDSTYGKLNAQGMIDWPDEQPARSADTVVGSPEIPGLVFHQVARHNIVVARIVGDLLSTSRSQAAILDTLRQHYDCILIDESPASRSFNGIGNASLVDALVLVVRAEVTRKPVVANLRDQIFDAGGKIVGVAMTCRRQYIPDRIYRFFF